MMKKLLCTITLLLFTYSFAQAQAEIDVLGNSISIIGDGTNTPNASDGTDFGQINVSSSSPEQLFTISNTGTAALSIFVSATTNPVFNITTTPAASVPAAGSTSIGITFNAPATAGFSNTQLFIFSSDSDENPYIINLLAEAISPVGPEINVTGNGISIIGDGTNTPNTADGTDFGQVAASTSSAEQIFVIQNLGTAPLTVNPSFTTNPVFAITTAAVSPVAVGGTTTIGITFNAPAIPGVINALLFITNGDSDENPYQINLRAESVGPPNPEINVRGNGISIIGDGTNTPNASDGTDFGQIDVSTSSTEQLFTIENTGTSALSIGSTLTTNPVFAITTAPASSVGAGGSTTIGITFNAPATASVFAEQLFIFNGDSDENPYIINLAAESVIPSDPEINVTGNGISIIGDGTNTPNVADGTDFGQVVASTSSAEQIFIIENNGTAPLTVNPSVTTNPVFAITTAAVSPVPIGSTTTIGITFNAPATAGISNATLFITNNDADENPYQINLTAETVVVAVPEMDVFGNGVEIADGDTTPSTADDTDFGQVDVTSGTLANTFTIENNGTADLNLTGAPLVDVTGTHAADFIVTTVPTSPIAAAGSTTFVITFNPSAIGIRTATVSIANDDSDENPYTFDIQGEGIDAAAGTPLLITQYYEGVGGNKWIEIKNISLNNVLGGVYSVALYTDSNTLLGTIDVTPPQQSVSIPFMAPGDVILFRNSAATSPGAGNLGPGVVQPSDGGVCNFDGDDVILISTSVGNNCYNDRIDIMGVVEPATGIQPFWGDDKGFVKGCGNTELPTGIGGDFDATVNGDGSVTVHDYLELTILEVDNAIPTTNIALGTQGAGTTTWTTSWDNGEPDRTRNAIISGTYPSSNGSIEACNLTVLGTIDFSGSTTNHVAVNEDLTISGTFTLGNNASLFTVDVINPSNTGLISGSITKSETTTNLVEFRDFTYWSSPVASQGLSSLFNDGTRLNRIFYWDQSVNVVGEWLLAVGSSSDPMTSGKGYIAEGPEFGSYPLQQTINFSGTPNNGTIRLFRAPNNDVVFNNDGDPSNDFNLVGNPYPSGLDADAFILDSDNATAIDGTLWFWSHQTQNSGGTGQYTVDDYAIYNLTGGTTGSPSGSPAPTQFIGSGQGFMVRTNSAVEIVEFNNAMRVKDQNTQFFRGTDSKKSIIEERDRIWLNIESNEGGAFNQILIGFLDEATDGFDRGYDGLKNSSNFINFYSTIEDSKYGIIGMGSFNLDRKVELSFDTYITDPITYKISIDNMEGQIEDNDIYLVDNELNITHDLKLADYEFDVNGEGFFPDRFTLQFTSSVLDIDDLELINDFVVINEENALRLRSNTVITNLKVYDIRGRLLIDKDTNESEFSVGTHNIRKGTILVINATFENGAELSKKAIKY